ncbi:HAD family hydrolase [Mycoplasmopsis agalactiae]|uniref:HAD family hydrolase n=1 Tax=Mycoplasmopsis agalactiae TaxID=2110 RepID=UPI001F15807F|nr:HAD family hydrolase [Mycoplasmopsis agalactiae]MCE6115494.1 HAD family hydrolase [Mycoplasmopsis agalactiae]
MSKINLNNIKYIFFDLDGTLLTKDKLITNEVINKIKELSKNHQVIINTGRPWYMAQKFYKQLDLKTPFLGLNGALVYDFESKKVLYQNPMSMETSLKLLNLILKYEIAFLIYLDDEMIGVQKFKHPWFEKVVYPTVYPKNEFSAKFTEINDPVNQLKLEKPVIKFLLLIDALTENQLETLKQEIESISDEIYTVRSQKACLDVMPKGSDKGTAIEWFKNNYLNHEDISNNSIMFGDAANDIPAFEKVAYSCALKSSSLEAENAANYVVCSSTENGIIEFFEKHTN